jgi:hypothetical protein
VSEFLEGAEAEQKGGKPEEGVHGEPRAEEQLARKLKGQQHAR